MSFPPSDGSTYSKRASPWGPTVASALSLIAQSLNRIKKANGEHNAILDNCDARVAFATNDEGTPKLILDALGTATEQQAKKMAVGSLRSKLYYQFVGVRDLRKWLGV